LDKGDVDLMNSKVIAVDFDGVIHKYSDGWKDGLIYDEPMDGAVDTIKRLQAEDFTIVVCTAREDSNLPLVRHWLESVCGLNDILVTNIKVPAMAYIDDRAIRFTNWSDIKRYFC